MPLVLAYAWAACILVVGLRAWASGADLPQGWSWLRLPFAAFPLILLLAMGLREGPSLWGRLPANLVGSGLLVAAVAAWALVLLHNGPLLIQLASADRRLVSGAWRLEALATDSSVGYQALAYRLGLRTAPTLMASPDLHSPVVVGAFSPVIVLPVAWIPAELRDFPTTEEAPADLALSPLELQAALAHELVHVAHRDNLRRLLEALGALLLPLECLPVCAAGLLQRGVPVPGTLRRWAMAVTATEERCADARVHQCFPESQAILERLRDEAPADAPAPRKPGTWQAFARQGLLAASALALLAMAPGRLDLAHAMGLHVPVPGQLPKGWVISCPFPRQVSYGFIPAAPGRTPAISIQLKDGACVLGHYTFVDRALLAKARRVEFEMDVDVLEGRLTPDTAAGFILGPYDVLPKTYVQSWRNHDRAGSLQQLSPTRFRFTNAVDLKDWDPALFRDLWIEVQLQSRGRFEFQAPHLWVILADGSRVPYGSIRK